jgi:predicted GNAT family N-acyltransferase
MDYFVRFASTAQDRESAFELRRAVFEVEQNVPRPLDRDVHDGNADHVLALDQAGRCIGTGRIVRINYRTAQLGRMAVAAHFRRLGVGSAMLSALERMACLRGVAELFVHSQLPAQDFHRNRGYLPEGGIFQEQGVPHVLMRKVLGCGAPGQPTGG